MLIIFCIFTPTTQTHNTMNQTIQIQDILDTIQNCNFSKEAQIELLQIVRYITLVKEHPDNICEILEQKIQLLQHPDNTPQPEIIEKACVKVKAVALILLLERMQVSRANHDLTKICKLIAFLTENSYHKIYNELQKGIILSEYHNQQIQEINKVLTELNLEITITPNKEY